MRRGIIPAGGVGIRLHPVIYPVSAEKHAVAAVIYGATYVYEA
jgi:hypothetical protein